MKTLTPEQLIAELELGAELFPQDSDRTLAVKVGRFVLECDMRAMTKQQQAHFAVLYHAGRINFGFPGDFRIKPFFFNGRPLRTRQCRIRLWDTVSSKSSAADATVELQTDDGSPEIHPWDLLDYAVGE